MTMTSKVAIVDQALAALAAAITGISTAAGDLSTVTVKRGAYDESDTSPCQAVVCFARLGRSIDAPYQHSDRELTAKVVIFQRQTDGTDGAVLNLEAEGIKAAADIEKHALADVTLGGVVDVAELDEMYVVDTLSTNLHIIDMRFVLQLRYPLDNPIAEVEDTQP